MILPGPGVGPGPPLQTAEHQPNQELYEISFSSTRADRCRPPHTGRSSKFTSWNCSRRLGHFSSPTAIKARCIVSALVLRWRLRGQDKNEDGPMRTPNALRAGGESGVFKTVLSARSVLHGISEAIVIAYHTARRGCRCGCGCHSPPGSAGGFAMTTVGNSRTGLALPGEQIQPRRRARFNEPSKGCQPDMNNKLRVTES